MIRRLLRWIMRAIGTYNPAPLDNGWLELGRGRLYVGTVDKDGKPTGDWHEIPGCTSFRIRTESEDSKP